MQIRFKRKTPVLGAGVYVAPTAAIIGDSHIGDESSVWFGACVRGDYGPIRIGKRCSIQDNVVVHVNHRPDGSVHPTFIKDDCVIGHGAVLEGCEIDAGCLIGMNAVILPRVHLRPGVIIAAGAVVTEGQDIPAHSLVAGAPATIKRRFDGPSDAISWAANEYVRLRQCYIDDSEILEDITE